MAKTDETIRPNPPDPFDIMDRLARGLEALTQMQQGAPQADHLSELMIRLSETMERMSASQVEGAKIIASESRRANRPSNEVVPMIGPFNRRGELLPADAEGPRKVPLKCPMFIPFIVEWESCTREEVDLLNLLEPGDYRLKLVDGTFIRMVVTIEYKLDGKTPSRLIMRHLAPDGTEGTAFSNKQHQKLPALTDWLRQLLRQHRPEVATVARAVMTDDEEADLIASGHLSVSVAGAV